MMHDPLCRAVYQRYTDSKDCTSCDLIWAVREDDKRIYDTSIGKLEAAYIQGYAQGIDNAVTTVQDYFAGVPSLPPVHLNAVIKYIRQS